ncbi:MAG: glutamate synthase-related protein, partial [Spirochaetaceae bacterium]|nr:glutamate synthase-related protein [Spirochaetaceae bacterium]
GLLEYAMAKLGVKSVELKFGQAAKGIQGMGRVSKIEDALRFKRLGWLVLPDPEDTAVAASHERGEGPHFEKIGRLPMWEAEGLAARVARLRELGAQRVSFKTGPFAPRDIFLILNIAAEAGVDMVTLDGAGGGTGHSPVRMMDEWGVPAVNLECAAHRMLGSLAAKGITLPQVAIAGGFATEDQVFKGLALGAPNIGFVAVGRAAMAAAMVGRKVGDALARGEVPKEFARFGSKVEDVFADYRLLAADFGAETATIPTGAIGVFSYLNRLTSGLRMLMALNRKFSLSLVGREDIVPLTREAARVSGLPTYEELTSALL